MKKLFFSLVLMFFVLMGSVRVYGFYQDTQTTQLTESSTHEVISQKLVTDSNKNLVPKGSVLAVDDIEEIVFEYQVFVQKDLEIECIAENLTMNGESMSKVSSHLFNFEFDQFILSESSIRTDLLADREDGYYLKVTLHVSMNTPTQEQYQTLAGQAINFDVLFRVKGA